MMKVKNMSGAILEAFKYTGHPETPGWPLHWLEAKHATNPTTGELSIQSGNINRKCLPGYFVVKAPIPNLFVVYDPKEFEEYFTEIAEDAGTLANARESESPPEPDPNLGALPNDDDDDDEGNDDDLDNFDDPKPEVAAEEDIPPPGSPGEESSDPPPEPATKD
jgi:hypothetical protein